MRKVLILTIIFLFLYLIIEWIYPDIFSNEIISYLVVGVGFALWIYSFQHNFTYGIFSGTLIFFSGIVLLVNSNFVIWNSSRMILPALSVSLGLALLFSFLNNKRFYLLLLSIVFLILGIVELTQRMSFKLTSFIDSIPILFFNVGLVVVAISLIVFFIIKKKKDYSEISQSKDENIDINQNF